MATNVRGKNAFPEVGWKRLALRLALLIGYFLLAEGLSLLLVWLGLDMRP